MKTYEFLISSALIAPVIFTFSLLFSEIEPEQPEGRRPTVEELRIIMKDDVDLDTVIEITSEYSDQSMAFLYISCLEMSDGSDAECLTCWYKFNRGLFDDHRDAYSHAYPWGDHE